MNFGDNLLDDSGVLEGEEARCDSGTKKSSMTTSISLSAIAGTVCVLHVGVGGLSHRFG